MKTLSLLLILQDNPSDEEVVHEIVAHDVAAHDVAVKYQVRVLQV